MEEKIENALNESRILVLVAQVLIGFQYQSIFQPGFEKLSWASQYLKLGGLGLMLLALTLFLAPAAYHRIVENGRLSAQFHQFITTVSMPALLPFALALGIDFYVMGDKLMGRPMGILSGLLACLIALFFWYGIEAMLVTKDGVAKGNKLSMSSQSTPLKDKIKFVLTEARVILPGAQALLGFQFTAILTESFEKLTSLAHVVHFVSLSCVALSTILLMAPAAFHRIVEKGENTERLYTFSNTMILAAMGLLAPGIAGDVFVVVQKVAHDSTWAWIASGLTLLVFYGEWFGYMLYRKAETPGIARQSVPSP